MPAATPDQPHQGSSAEPRSFWGLIATFFVASPVWLRAVVMVVIALSVAYVIVKRPQGASETPAHASATYPMSQGNQVDAPGNHNQDPRNIEAKRKIDEDNEHLKWHTVHDQIDPGWNLIGEKMDDNNFIEYKYYAKSDKCVYILRMVQGVATTQWVKFPSFEGAPSLNGGLFPLKGGRSLERLSTSLSALFPTVEAASRPHPGELLGTQQVQSGCLNPHPWQFQWWWGQPADQCWSPMYRKWGDGCLHYQWFNRCANSWDPQIHWVTCVGSHHP